MFYVVSNAGFPPGEILPLRSFSNIRKFTITKNIAINEGGGEDLSYNSNSRGVHFV